MTTFIATFLLSCFVFAWMNYAFKLADARDKAEREEFLKKLREEMRRP